jgi:hypothetical protein
VTTTKKIPSGAWEVSDIVGGYLVTRTYYGYTKSEALALFRKDTKKEPTTRNKGAA